MVIIKTKGGCPATWDGAKWTSPVPEFADDLNRFMQTHEALDACNVYMPDRENGPAVIVAQMLGYAVVFVSEPPPIPRTGTVY